MDLRIITVGKLNDFVAEAAFATLPDVPITPLRAFSQQLNPNANTDDAALVVAYNNEGEVLAYFGCLPDRLQNNLTEKYCWSSCWWVHPTKGQVAGMPVFYKALQLWDAKMLFDALPERSAAVLEKMGYFSFREISGVHAFLRFKFHKIIPSRFPFLAPLKNVCYVLDSLLNIPVQIRLAFAKRKYKISDPLQTIRIEGIDEETENFIQALSKSEVIHRSQTTFNWILQNSWLTPNKTFTKRYFFSSYANHFENILLKVKKDKQLIAFLWLTLRDGTAKLPYSYIQPGNEKAAADVLMTQLIEQPIDTFICFQQNLLPHLAKNKTPFLYKKQVSKTFGWTKTLDTYFSNDFYIQDGDGDGVFT